MMTRLNVLLVVLALVLMGCPRPLFLPDRNLDKYVTEQNVVGAWTLQDQSLGLLGRDGFKSSSEHQYQIRFLAGGTCEFRSVINDVQGGIYYEVEGTWLLLHDVTRGSNTKKKNEIRIELPLPDVTHRLQLNLDRVDGALVLWQFYGDPDSWEFMEYAPVENEGKE
jgi:hypothetical protein